MFLHTLTQSLFKKTLSLSIILAHGLFLSAQTSFGLSYLEDQQDDYDSFVAIGVADMNADHKDDVIFFDGDNNLHIAYQTAPNAPFEVKEIGISPAGVAWSFSIGDLDGDHLPEIVIAGAFTAASVYKRVDLDSDYEFWYNLPSSNIFSQGSNMIDINGDQFLDVFICNDLGDNNIYINDGTGQLIYDANYPFDVPINQDNSGNYATAWSDIDNDGDLDMYLAKCKQGELDQTASTRINLLHINNGDGSYTEMGEIFGLDIGAQSWSADFGDVDNDGDMDLLIINHFEAHQLLLQQADGSFINSSGFSSIAEESFAVQGMFADLDNNGFIDIILTGDSDYIYYNQGNDTFILDPFPFAAQDANSVAFGDLNQDGALDAYISYYTSLGSNINYPDVLYINESAARNFATFSLLASNPSASAIGARLTCHSDGFSQIREVKSGQSYGIVNSLKQHFGLGTDSSIDSLRVDWPNGSSDFYLDLDVNEHYVIRQGICISKQSLIQVVETTQLCGDAAELYLDSSGASAVVWSTGETSDTIVSSQAGVYNAEIIDVDGCSSISNNILLTQGDANQNPLIQSPSGLMSCLGDSLEITIPGFERVTWSDGDTSLFKVLSSTDTISAIAYGACDSYLSDTLIFNFINANDFSIEGDSIKKGESALVKVFTEIEDSCLFRWYETETSQAVLSTGDSFMVPLLESDTSFYVAKTVIKPQTTQETGIEIAQETASYSGNSLNGGLIFDVLQDCVIKSIDLTTDSTGVRTIIIKDESSTLVYSNTVSLNLGTQTVTLNAELNPGVNYEITTETSQNILSFGYNGPRLVRNDQGVFYPYEIEDVLSIERSSFGPDNYYYFYNWKVSLPDLLCVSDRKEVPVAVEGGNSVITTQLPDDIKVFPNPTNDVLTLEGDDIESSILIDLQGRSFDLPTGQNDLRTIQTGMYFIKIKRGKDIFITKILIQR